MLISRHRMLVLTLILGSVLLMTGLTSGPCAPDPAAKHWNATDRGAKVAAIIPGRTVPKYTPETLYAEWTKQQVERWAKDHPAEAPAEAYRKYAAADPSDALLTSDFPVHISPFGRLKSQAGGGAARHVTDKADKVLHSYCPLCGSYSFGLKFDSANPFRKATTNCCRTDLFARNEDWPAGSPLKPNSTVKFLHLDDSQVEVPCTVFKDKEGVEWELFFSTIFAHKRWLDHGSALVRQYSQSFQETANPLYVHKIAILLDKVADTYYALPLASMNRICMGRDGKGLTRAEWEAVPRPAIFEVSYLGPWSKRMPISSPGWLNMMHEHLWVEPFGRVRHHPAFKEVSRQLYNDPEALDKKVRHKLMRELSLMFQSVFSQKLLHNYQEAIYINLWLLGILAEEPVLINFAAPCQELSMYNHTYQDGMNGEGAPNYMMMPGGYYYPVLKDPKGWLQYQPKFLEEHPFFWAASSEMYKSTTVRGQRLEWGDEHQHVFSPSFLSDPVKVAENEKTGSRNWAGYGVGVLRVGGPGQRMEMSLGYTRAALHNAQDAMSMECWVDGVPMMRRGGYAAWWSNARLQWDRPEYQALKQMDYPYELAEGGHAFDGWSWIWAHSPLNQNTLTVDEVATGAGWGDNRGYGESITFKGGEAAGTPGSGFQVLEVVDHYSWSRVDKEVKDWRRAAIGVEGPDGRAYVVDITRLLGGSRHALYNQAWADRAEAQLPPVKSRAKDLTEVFFGGKLPEDNSHYRNFTWMRNVERLQPQAPTYDVTWKQDYGRWAQRDITGKPYQRPIPEDVGKVRLRFIGVNAADKRTELLSGKGPWVGWMRQSLPQGQAVNGNVAFMDARDFLVEYRTGGTAEQPLESRFVHLLEGFREGAPSAIKSVTPLAVTSLRGPQRHLMALKLDLAAGHSDTVIYQSEPGTVRLPDGTETDARYALVRRAAGGEIITAEAVRSTFLKAGKFSATMPGDFTGAIVDVIGDLTGDRRQSALVIRPDKPWPAGENLADRQLNIRFTSDLRDPCDEGYRIAKTTLLEGGLVRVDLQDYAPFAVSWHEVSELPADKPNSLRTWRPMVDHGNGPWYRGMKMWFPERDKLYTIKTTNEVGGGYGGDRAEVVEKVNLAAEGIKPGDWYIIYGVQPGLQVRVANDFTWRREPVKDWRQFSLRATGEVTVQDAALSNDVRYQAPDGAWQGLNGGRSLTVARQDDQATVVIKGRPAWLNLNDQTAPQVVRLTLDGQALDLQKAADLGWIDPPRSLEVQLADTDNPLDRSGLQVTLNGRRIEAAAAGLVKVTEADDGKRLTVTVDLAKATEADRKVARQHSLLITVSDRSLQRRTTQVPVVYKQQVALEANAVYLSDLKEIHQMAHGALQKNRDYIGGVAEIAGRVYSKGLTLCPKDLGGNNFAEVIYELTPELSALTFKADVGITSSSRGGGSAVFLVQTGPAQDGPWELKFTSPILRGGNDPLTVKVPLAKARFLRLSTTDAGDGINSDHAHWGNARLVKD